MTIDVKAPAFEAPSFASKHQKLEGKSVLITGGVRGIGGEIAKTLRGAGYKVIASCQEHTSESTKFSQENGIFIYPWDVGNFDACQEAVARITQQHGPINVLINNAGISLDANFESMTLTQWHGVMSVNLNGPFYMCKLLVPAMKAGGWGRIVNIGSVNAHVGARGLANYCASKAGLEGLSRALAAELSAFGITVNVVAPGYTHTQMLASLPAHILERIISNIPLKRLGKAQEVAALVAFLLRPEADFITGSVLHINGGQWMN